MKKLTENELLTNLISVDDKFNAISNINGNIVYWNYIFKLTKRGPTWETVITNNRNAAKTIVTDSGKEVRIDAFKQLSTKAYENLDMFFKVVANA